MGETSKRREEGEIAKAEEPLRREEPTKPSSQNPPKPISPASNAFSFWAYFTLFVSISTLLLASLRLLSPSDHGSWFLALPADLRGHYSNGKLIKVQLGGSSRPTIQVFAVEQGPKDGEAVVLVHGLGCSSFSFRRVLQSLAAGGLRAVAIDLPGSGFSDKLDMEMGRRWGGPLGWIWDVYDEIKEKGLFYGFDQLIETGQIPYEEGRVSKSDVLENSGYGSAEMGAVIGQVIDSLALAPVHLVLHDSALGPGANWVSVNPASVRSMTLIDSTAQFAAFPSSISGVPVLGELLLSSQHAFTGLLRLCCSRSIDGSAAEAYRLLLKGKDGRRAIVAAGKAMNFSFDLGEWTGSEVARDLPLQVLWSNSWSDRWIVEGRRTAAAVPKAKFAWHSGSRWPQEDAVDDITERIVQFLSSLPKSSRQIKEEPLPEHIQKMFDQASGSDYDHHNHQHGHGHEHAAGYGGMYGLGQGW